MIKKTKGLFLHPVKKEILEQLEKTNSAFYGDIVMELDHPQNEILKHLIELKENGFVYKGGKGGKFHIVKN
jgi:DNA-binding transcriptional ArsR family regulator